MWRKVQVFDESGLPAAHRRDVALVSDRVRRACSGCGGGTSYTGTDPQGTAARRLEPRRRAGGGQQTWSQALLLLSK